jgi:hypothetical protein
MNEGKVETTRFAVVMNMVVDALWSALALSVGGFLVAVVVYAFVMPDPAMEESGARGYAAMMERLEDEQMQCEAQMLHDVRLYRAPTQADVDEVHAACDRTSAWR